MAIQRPRAKALMVALAAVIRRPLAVACAISVLPALYVAQLGSWTSPDQHRHQSLFDDAMISMSYARTLASGHGLAWYPGADRVEGITNLGWTLVMAGVHGVGLSGDGAVVAMKVLGLLAVWLSAAVGCSIGRTLRGAESGPTRFFTALAVVVNVPLLFWSVQGMEVGLMTLLTLLTCLLVWRITTCAESSGAQTFALGAVVVMGVVTRTDFVLVPLASCAWAAVAARRELNRVVLPLVGGAAIAAVGTMVFRLLYFGDPVPNTYFLKLTGAPLATRIGRGATVALATSIGFIGPGMAVIAVAWKRLRSDEQRLLGLLLTVAAAQIGYCIYVGGDAWEKYLLPNRYLTPAVVCVVLCACLAAFADQCSSTSPQQRWRLACGLATITALGPALGAGLFYVVGPVATRLGLPEVGRTATAQAALIALTACLAVVGGAYLLAAQRVLRRATAFAGAVTLCLLIGIVPQARTLTRGSGDGGASVFALLGSQLAYVTTDDAVIAVSGAGASQYVSDRRMIDLLGKSDRHIARGPVATDRLIPGHNKFDSAYSVGQLQPDVVAQPLKDASDTVLRAYGYVPMRLSEGQFVNAGLYDGQSVVYVRTDSANIRYDRLLRVDP